MSLPLKKILSLSLRKNMANCGELITIIGVLGISLLVAVIARRLTRDK